MDKLLPFLIMFGGGLGAAVRYVVGIWMMKKYPTPFIPIAMLSVNIIGSFALGIIYGVIYDDHAVMYSNPYFITIGIGFLGAFTTFSTFSVEAMQLIKGKVYRKAALYIVLSIIGSILSFALAFNLIKI